MSHSPFVYMAGPDVFSPDYAALKQKLKTLCAQAGLHALCPGDDEIEELPLSCLSQLIFEHNIALIDQADYVMANVSNFRGHEPDSGTVFEIGYAVAKGKKVWCYNVPKVCLRDQIHHEGSGFDRDGLLIENFGLPRNLMLMHSCEPIEAGAEDCINQITQWHNRFTAFAMTQQPT